MQEIKVAKQIIYCIITIDSLFGGKSIMTFNILTLGCKANQYDSAYMEKLLRDEGYTAVSHTEQAELIIVNSCTVTATADSKSGKALRRARRENPNALIVLTGCMAQTKQNVEQAFPEADIVMGIAQQKDIVSVVSGHEKARIAENDGAVSGFIEAFKERSRAFLKIEDGCNNFCAYCIVPFARGRVRSKDKDAVLREVDVLSDSYEELVLTGINLSAYGSDKSSSLIELLEAIEEQGRAKRVRISSFEPHELTDDFITRLSKLKCICPHLHLSLQSGCDATLMRMGRRNDTAFLKNAIEKLRTEINGVQLTCDVIVGFPGETQEEFEATYNLLSSIGLLDMHVFRYSKRPGTISAVMPSQVAPQIKEERKDILLRLAEEAKAQILASYIGKSLEVLFESEKNGVCEGFSREYIPVVSSSAVCGEVSRVLITGSDGKVCYA